MVCRERPPWRSVKRRCGIRGDSRNATEGVPYSTRVRLFTLTADLSGWKA